jgi:hypothetical protein
MRPPLPHSDVSFERLTDPGGAGFEALYRIYCEAFSPGSRKSRDEMAAMTRDNRYRVIALVRRGQVCGFASLYRFDDPAFALLEYLAIDASLRSGGFGSSLVTAGFGAVAEPAGPIPVLIEVSSSRDDMDDTSEAARRIRFYTRLGCRRVQGLDYLLPLYPGPIYPPMELLLWLPEPQPSIPQNALRLMVENVYDRIYGCPRDDARIAAMFMGMPETIPLV